MAVPAIATSDAPNAILVAGVTSSKSITHSVSWMIFSIPTLYTVVPTGIVGKYASNLSFMFCSITDVAISVS